jgi:hypothetical protein
MSLKLRTIWEEVNRQETLGRVCGKMYLIF